MSNLHVRFLRFSAFYSPLLVTMRGGHLASEGLDATYDTVTADRTVEAGFRDGTVDLAQSALAVHFAPWSNGEELPYRHFAVINRHDGFFLARRAGVAPDSSFSWSELRGATIVADHFFQPMALLRSALAAHGLATDDVHLVDAGTPDEMLAAFRSGVGDYVHLQGPAPHQLEVDGVATVVASIGTENPALAFSTLCATPEWLRTDAASAFLRAFRAGREHAQEAPAAEIASIVAPFLPDIGIEAITNAVSTYQAMGTWTGSIEIDEALHRSTIGLFRQHGGLTVDPPIEACAESYSPS